MKRRTNSFTSPPLPKWLQIEMTRVAFEIEAILAKPGDPIKANWPLMDIKSVANSFHGHPNGVVRKIVKELEKMKKQYGIE